MVRNPLSVLVQVFVRPGEDSFESIGSANGQQPSEQAWAAVLRDFFPLPADDSEDPVRVGDRVLVRARRWLVLAFAVVRTV